jgi:superfamily II DNA or RNA helicase
MRYLAKNEERNALIVKHAVKCIKAGRSLVIPVGLVDHANELTDAINKAMGKNVAVAFVSKGLSKARRAEILEGARSYKIKCIVGIRSLVQTGINVPRWDTLFVVTPISNVPKFTQETSRIRTVVDGKKPPLILHFMESPFAPSTGCFRTCYFQTYIKDRFHISDDTKKLAAAYLSTKKSSLNSSFSIV